MRISFGLALMSPFAAGAEQTSVADEFRSVFALSIDPTGTHRDQVDHVIFAPLPQLLNESDFFKDRCQGTDPYAQDNSEIVARGMLCKMNSVYSQVSADELYHQGQTASLSTFDLKNLAAKVKSDDLLMVVVPGIFGEFIQKRAFEEIFPVVNAGGKIENDSSFAANWRAALQAKAATELGNHDCATAPGTISVCDEQEQLSRLTPDPASRGQMNISMGELMDVGSIDDTSGQSVVRAVLFHMDPMTLESLGKQERNATIFTRRLEKFFAILGHVPRSIVFVGYSRGTDYALEMLSQAKVANKSWLKNVKAMVSLGGVVFGSALADDVVLNAKNPMNQQIAHIEVFTKSLAELPSADEPPWGPNNLKSLGDNWLAWWKFIQAALHADGNSAQAQRRLIPKIAQSVSNDVADMVAWLKRIGQDRAVVDPSFLMHTMINESLKFGLVTGTMDQSLQSVSSAMRSLLRGDSGPMAKFFHDHWPSTAADGRANPYTVSYNSNIRRFQKLVAAAITGVDELSTDSRLHWWRTHQIPVGFKYYSLSATMAEPGTPLALNRDAFNPDSPDDLSLTQNWKDFNAVQIAPEYAGEKINDSQMAMYKTIFWPQIIESLNPANAGVQSTPLGILGTHHWGLALPVVIQVKRLGGDQDLGVMAKNPFPRVALLQALAFVVADQDSRNAGADQ